jgi:hypothetical protein
LWISMAASASSRITLLAMAQNRSSRIVSKAKKDQDQARFDLIPGKGKCLIVLLYCQPGVGKPSTAELVAAHAHRPLLPIVRGEIGMLNSIFGRFKLGS